MAWYDKMWSYSVELFRSLDIPVRQLECCSGDLADLKVKSCDIEAWSPPAEEVLRGLLLLQHGRRPGPPAENPRQGARTARTTLPHTLNNTVVAPPPDAHRLPGEQPPGRRQRAHPRGIAALHGRQGRHPLTAIQRRTGLGACPFLLEKNEKRSSPAAGELLGKRLWKVFRVCAKTCGKHVGRLKKPRKYAGKVFHRFFSPC